MLQILRLNVIHRDPIRKKSKIYKSKRVHLQIHDLFRRFDLFVPWLILPLLMIGVLWIANKLLNLFQILFKLLFLMRLQTLVLVIIMLICSS